jgi:hypothetical protein
MSKTFNLKCGYRIECRSENTRYGFRHLAEVFDTRGNRVGKSKACYYNRTWESFEFESVIATALSGVKAFDDSARRFIMDSLRDEAHGRVAKQFAFIGGIAKLGGIFCDKPAEQNDWKARMLKAGLPGLSLPDDWNTLNETEKARRLDAVIAECGK